MYIMIFDQFHQYYLYFFKMAANSFGISQQEMIQMEVDKVIPELKLALASKHSFVYLLYDRGIGCMHCSMVSTGKSQIKIKWNA